MAIYATGSAFDKAIDGPILSSISSSQHSSTSKEPVTDLIPSRSVPFQSANIIP